MPTFETSSPTYTQLLNGLPTLETTLTPRVKLLRKLVRQGRLQLARDVVQADPLLREFLKLMRRASKVVGDILEEYGQ